MTMTSWRLTVCAFASVLILFSMAPAPVRAQDESELATKTQNPVAELISVPLENNINVWKDDHDRWALPTDTTLLDRPVPAASAPSAAVSPGAGEPGDLEDYDPWEEFNAKAFEFNRRMDKYALKPVVMGWKTVVPQPAGIMIANAFDNLTVVPRVVNNLLQGKWDGAGREVTRFLINSTAGVGGLHDPAKDVWHITKSPADFGQTLGKWGIGPGPYLVLPFMEPLTVRDGIGKVVDRTFR